MHRSRTWAAAFLLLVVSPAVFAQTEGAIKYVSPETGRAMQVDPVPPLPRGRTTQSLPDVTEAPASSQTPVESMPKIPVAAEQQEQAPEQPAQQPLPVVAGPAAPVFNMSEVQYGYTPDYWVAPRVSLRRSFGDDVGYDNGYTYLEGFAPFLQDAGNSLLFANSRVVNYDHADFWEFQAGGGGRRLIGDSFVAGLNGFYDGRNTNFNFFNQLGVGWEVLGAVWEWRGNVYVPVGQQRAGAGGSGFFNPMFVNTNISLDQILFNETAMNGVQTEVGRSLIVRDRLNLRGYVGYYHYSNDGVQTANGIRGRLEAWVTENMSFNFAVQNDAVFDTTVTGGLALHLGGLPRGLRRTDPLRAKLGERVVRDPNIVVQRTEEFRRELAIDPATGAPIEVRHVSSDAAAGGDGSVERPFQNLTQLQNGSGPGMILFAHSGSVFDGEGIVLQNNQRFLGEGIPYFFTATQGTFLLPTATGGTVQPRIQNAPDAAVVLASNNEVANFGISNSARVAIEGVGINNFNIHDNRIVDNGRGIRLIDTTGTGFITDNRIEDNIRAGIRIRNNTGDLNVSITGNELLNNGIGGGPPRPQINMAARGDATITATVADNLVNLGFDDGLRAAVQDNATFNLTVVNNTFDSNCCAGVRLRSQDNGQMNAVINGNFFTNQNDSAINAVSRDSSQMNITADGNNFLNNALAGVELVSRDVSVMTAGITNNSFNGNLFDLLAESRNSSLMTLGVLGNSSINGASGMDVTSRNSSSLNMALHNNTSDVGYFLTENGSSIFRLERDAAGNFPPTDNTGTLMLAPPGNITPAPFGSLFP